METARCIAFADLRGDYRLLTALLTQVMDVATDTDNGWQWTTENTTLICLGNFVDRYAERGFNRLSVTTEQAIEDEINIVKAFQDLRRPNDQNNQLVILLGNHEMGNLLQWPNYTMFQMQKPENSQDQAARQLFIEQHLRPLALEVGLMARWGLLGGTLYFSHAGLDLSWFKQFKPQSIPELNRDWQRWLRTRNFTRLNYLRDSRSPVLSNRDACHPDIWRENDAEVLIRVLGDDPSPRFVQSGLPVQELLTESWDPFLRPPGTQAGHVLVARKPSGDPQLYFIHNAMADVFCQYVPEQRQPQALEFKLFTNDQDEALYLEEQVLVMSPENYATYLQERKYGMCVNLPPAETPTLTEDEFLQLNSLLSPEDRARLVAQNSHIRKVVLILFNMDFQKVYLTRNFKTGKWSFLHGNNTEDQAWASVRKLVPETLQFTTMGTVTDFQVSTRVWIKQTLDSEEWAPNGEWVSYEHILDRELDRFSKLLLCIFIREKLLWPVEGEACAIGSENIPPLTNTASTQTEWWIRTQTQ